MNDLQYLYPVNGGRWAIGYRLGGRYISLVEGCPTKEEDVRTVLAALGLPDNQSNRQEFFPSYGHRKFCPTIYLLERFSLLDGGLKNLAGV